MLLSLISNSLIQLKATLDLQATLGLSGVPTVLADALYDTATEQSNDAEGGKDLSEDAFMIFLATCIKVSSDLHATRSLLILDSATSLRLNQQ